MLLTRMTLLLQADKGFMRVCSAKRKHLGPEGSSGILLCRAVEV